MEHDPRTPKQNVENPVDSQDTDSAAEAGQAMEAIEEAEAIDLEQLGMAGESTGAKQAHDLSVPMATSTSNAEEPFDGPAQAGFEVPSAPALDEVGVSPPVAPPISDLLFRPGEPLVIERGPYIPAQHSEVPPIKLLDDTVGASEQANESASTADLSPRTKRLLLPTADGGPPLARPIVIVSLADVQQTRIREEALAAAAERDNKTTGEIAEEKVNYAFWRFHCEERALWGDY